MKFILLFLVVIGAFGIMLSGMFFSDYKKMRTKYRLEKGKANSSTTKPGFSSCAGCSGTDCHN